MDVEGPRTQKIDSKGAKPVKRLRKGKQGRGRKAQSQETPPQIDLAESKDGEDGKAVKPKVKKISKAKQRKELYKTIDEYRHRILEKVNQECNDYKAAMLREEEERKNTTISFNRKKEVLEFCKNILRQSRVKRTSEDTEVKPYEIKSVLKGSKEVYTGRVSSKRNSILGNYHINEESVPELQSEEMSEIKQVEESAEPSPQDSPKKSPKSNRRQKTDGKKDKQSK